MKTIMKTIINSTTNSETLHINITLVDSCCACGLQNEDVERSGIDYCPNPICNVSGAYWFRRLCSTYKNTFSGSHIVGHIVDPNEMFKFGTWLLQADIGEFTEPVKKSLDFWQKVLFDLDTAYVIDI